MVMTPTVPQIELLWPHAFRLTPARFQALDCFERILWPGEEGLAEMLSRLSDLTAGSGAGDMTLMDPGKILFGSGTGWINTAYTVPRAARFSTARRGAFYVGSDLDTCIAEVGYHIETEYRRQGVSESMDLDYRALRIHVEGTFHDIRGKSRTRRPWAGIYADTSYIEAQTFAETLRDAGSPGLLYDSLRKAGGACGAVFDPNALRGCRHNTYLAFRWSGQAVAVVMEKRIRPFHR